MLGKIKCQSDEFPVTITRKNRSKQIFESDKVKLTIPYNTTVATNPGSVLTGWSLIIFIKYFQKLLENCIQNLIQEQRYK